MRLQKITFGEMRSGGGPTGILVYCADYRCSHSIEMSAEQWPEDVRLSDIEPRFLFKTAASAAPMSAALSARENGDCQLDDALLPLLIWVQCFLFGLQFLDELLETLKGPYVSHASAQRSVAHDHLTDLFAFPTHSQFPACVG